MKNIVMASLLLVVWKEGWSATISKKLVKVGDCVEIPTGNPAYYKNKYRLKVHSEVRTITGLKADKNTYYGPEKIILSSPKEKVEDYFFYPGNNVESAKEACLKAKALIQQTIDSEKDQSSDCGGSVSSSDRSLNEKAESLGSKVLSVPKNKSSKQ